ncbi:MAG: MgtC/SapB family protein [Mogibacterium sp.]|nr:MgtC/SapB family protein [Mogibacterium sp.]
MMIADIFPWLLVPSLPTILIRTVLAVICAGAVGYDRNIHGASAGLRTHILVCVGAMLAMSTGQFASMYYSADATRIGAQVVSGIGFLGAGTIMVTKKNHIHGLTTAAGLWAAACIGLALGIGFYEGAIVGAIVVYVTIHMLRRFSLSLRKAHADDIAADNAGNREADKAISAAEETLENQSRK